MALHPLTCSTLTLPSFPFCYQYVFPSLHSHSSFLSFPSCFHILFSCLSLPLSAIGSEAIYRGEMTEADSVALLKYSRERLRAAGCHLPLTTVETRNKYFDSLIEEVDVVMVNQHPVCAVKMGTERQGV